MKRIVLCMLIMLGVYSGQAQNCSILSDTVVCLSDFITFQAQGSGNITAYHWDLDEGQSATVAAPFATYSQAGLKTIRLIVQFQGGGSCTTTKVIRVYPNPIASFVIDSISNYCLSRNQVCIKDLSLPLAQGSSIVQRVTLFGDGAADINTNPGSNKTVCHTYSGPGKFTIVVEVTTDKGCMARTQREVTILQDARALFAYELFGNCDTASLCFRNLVNTDSANISKWYWDFGDGTRDSIHWSAVCHDYRDSGSFSPALIIKEKNGCADTFRQNQLVNLNPVVFKVTKDRYETCYGELYHFEDEGPAKDKYFWFYRDSGSLVSYPLGEGKVIHFPGPGLGKKYIHLTVQRGHCVSSFTFDSIYVRGPIAAIDARNRSICSGGDSTWFCDLSNYYASLGVKRIWDLDDQYCLPCTTDTENGLNTGLNCRYSLDENPVHLYTVDTCYRARLILYDTITGCADTAHILIQRGRPKPETIQLLWSNDKACTGLPPDHSFHFTLAGNCYNYQILPDSASHGIWYRNLSTYNYPTFADSNGNVTVGLILEAGPLDSSSCPGITSGPVCRDTFWYPNLFNLIPEPEAIFSMDTTVGCAPLEAHFTFLDSSDTNLVMMIWDWGDGSIDTIEVDTGTKPPTSFKHVYHQNGQYYPGLSLINKRGCFAGSRHYFSIGHRNRFDFYTDTCLNNCFVLRDSTRYFQDSNYYWFDANRTDAGKEKTWWHYQDGSMDSGTHPTFCLKDPGHYEITLITMDSLGCLDTSVKAFDVGGIEAAFRGVDEILCSEIMQFFDSSYLIDSARNEWVAGWYWDFGDGKTPSYLQDPFHFYSSYGTFKVMLVIGTNRGCMDTAYREVTVRGPLPSFEFVTDSIGCAPLRIELENTSSQVRNWIWHFGDPNSTIVPTLSDTNVSFTYTRPGVYYLQLYGADSIYNESTGNNQYCSVIYPDTLVPGQIPRKVIVQASPPVDFLAPDTLCVNKPLILVDQSDPKYTWYRWYLDGADSLTGPQKFQVSSFGDTGWHRIDYRPTYVPGPFERSCFDSAVKQVYVVDLFVDFDIYPHSTPLDLYFQNLSEGATGYDWDFGQPSSGSRNHSTAFEPSHLYYPETGRFTICLIGNNPYGCRDTVCREVELDYQTRLFIPNVFTPGNTIGYNDAFDIDIEGEAEYHVRIYNRYGQLVFEGLEDGFDNDGINWNGDLPNGSPAPAGVYFVLFDYRFLYTDPVMYKGTLTLIRE